MVDDGRRESAWTIVVAALGFTAGVFALVVALVDRWSNDRRYDVLLAATARSQPSIGFYDPCFVTVVRPTQTTSASMFSMTPMIPLPKPEGGCPERKP